jgi:hypothetical protein
MSAIAATLAAYKRLSGKLDLPELEARRVMCETQIFGEEGAVLDKIKAFAPDEGWLRYQSELVAVEAGAEADAWKPRNDSAGRLLYGELVKVDDSQSLAVRPLGDRWRVVTITEGSGNQQYLAEQVAFLRDVPGIRRTPPAAGKEALRYVVYWAVDARGSRPALSRFTGFGKG